MIAVVIAMAASLLAAIGLAVFQAIRADRRITELLDVHARLGLAKDEWRTKVTEAERAIYERGKLADALESEQRRGDALEEFIATEAADTDPHADLAADDVAGRVLRLTRTMSGRKARDTVPAGSGPVLHPNATEA